MVMCFRFQITLFQSWQYRKVTDFCVLTMYPAMCLYAPALEYRNLQVSLIVHRLGLSHWPLSAPREAGKYSLQHLIVSAQLKILFLCKKGNGCQRILSDTCHTNFLPISLSPFVSVYIMSLLGVQGQETLQDYPPSSKVFLFVLGDSSDHRPSMHTCLPKTV